MNAAGVVVEYNPFHNGHAHHLLQTRQLTNADAIVAVMSGSFLQRGEPAIVSKWARTKMALEGGADLIIELPYAYSTQNAEMFAKGAVCILDELGVKELCFGSESGQIQPFLLAVQKKHQFIDSLNKGMKVKISKGISYPKAMAETLTEVIGKDTLDLSQPNNILGFHYVEAILNKKSPIIPRTIGRMASHYHDKNLATSTIASATSIRKFIFTNSLRSVATVIPQTTFHHLQDYYKVHSLFHDWEKYFPFLKYKLLTMNSKELKQIYEVEEGLENRLLSYIRNSTSFLQFMQHIKTKRYTWTRLQRLCVHVLTGTTKEQMMFAKELKTVPYMRILGMTQKGQAYLSEKKKNIMIPLLSNGKHVVHPLFQIDLKAGAVYTSILPEPVRTQAIRTEQIQYPLRYNEMKKQFI